MTNDSVLSHWDGMVNENAHRGVTNTLFQQEEKKRRWPTSSSAFQERPARRAKSNEVDVCWKQSRAQRCACVAVRGSAWLTAAEQLSMIVGPFRFP